MINTQLFLAGEEVEIDSSVVFNLNKQFRELSDPTIICSDYSKTVNIPFTAHNNKLFGYLYRTDRNVTNELNPSKRVEFYLLHNGERLMSGYAKINGIKKENGSGFYELNLFGKLGELFSEMKALTITKPTDTEDEDQMKYYIGEEVIDEVNKDLVKTSWTNEPDLDTPLENADTTDIIGFSCSNTGYNEDFESNSYQYSATETREFKDFPINGKTLEQIYEEENISWDSVMSDGLLSRQWGEYRSYYQIPFIYVPRMFDILEKKLNELTDYTLDLDSSWFNVMNPYYRKLVMMLSRLSREEQTSVNNYNMYPNPTRNQWKIGTINDYVNWINNITVIEEQYPIYAGEFNKDFNLSPDYSLQYHQDYKFNCWWHSLEANGYIAYLTNETKLIIEARATGTNGTQKTIHRTVIASSNTSYEPAYNENLIKINALRPDTTRQNYTFVADGSFDTVFDYSTFGDGVRIDYLAHWEFTQPYIMISLGAEGHGFGQDNSDTFYCQPDSSHSTTDAVTSINVVVNSRSHSKLSLEYMWNSDITFFDQILKYTKMFNLLWVVDEENKKLKILPWYKYFEDYSIEDWTDKIDFSSDYSLTPITYENKYYRFNYEDSDTKLNESYKQLYGTNYGEVKVKTNYQFNNETKDLFEDIPTSITSTEHILPWSGIRDRNFTYINPGENMPCLFNSDNEYSDGFGQFYFYTGLKRFSTASGLSLIYLTDDTEWQRNNKTYMYLEASRFDSSISTQVTTYPGLELVFGNKICLFNIPKRSFSTTTSFKNCSGIFEDCWKLITENEMLNQNVHKLECQVRLSQQDFKEFSFKRFVVVNNQLYLVNKISDYNISNPTTKCELIKVIDLQNYLLEGKWIE